MEDLFKGQLPEGERPDLQIYIFPHLQEFLTIDLREDSPQVLLLNTYQVFGEDFFKTVEKEFSLMIREENEFPFAHLINLPLRLEEIIRGIAMNYILERLGIDPEDEEQIPAKADEDLELLSIEELTERIAGLHDEIRRLEAAIERKQAARGAADSVFDR